MYSKIIAAIFLASTSLGTLAAPLPRVGEPEINARDCIMMKHDACLRDIAEDVGKREPVGQA
ncbi:hypothetical protein PILCRDRAFT_4619 [Piloderma croceum F 1598]|uniref:Uncharacterized protein n=1 Tax=Piloderma croceum (strain F 1598) TaxID=765440 RepID=A0A0C3G7U2_PILCF|nr:hypothetical protein PILCRDRAFT_4619 [Piloderma croceum F 1598]